MPSPSVSLIEHFDLQQTKTLHLTLLKKLLILIIYIMAKKTCVKNCCECCELADLYRELVSKLITIAVHYQKKLPLPPPQEISFVGDSD